MGRRGWGGGEKGRKRQKATAGRCSNHCWPRGGDQPFFFFHCVASSDCNQITQKNKVTFTTHYFPPPPPASSRCGRTGPLNHIVSCCFSQAVEQTTGSDCVTVVGGEVCRDRCILLLQLVCSCVVVLPCGVRCEEQPSTSSQVWLAGFPPDG